MPGAQTSGNLAITSLTTTPNVAHYVPTSSTQLSILGIESSLQTLTTLPSWQPRFIGNTVGVNNLNPVNLGADGNSGNGPYYIAAAAGGLLVADSFKKLWAKKKPDEKKKTSKSNAKINEASEDEHSVLPNNIKAIITAKL